MIPWRLRAKHSQNAHCRSLLRDTRMTSQDRWESSEISPSPIRFAEGNGLICPVLVKVAPLLHPRPLVRRLVQAKAFHNLWSSAGPNQVGTGVKQSDCLVIGAYLPGSFDF